MIHQTTFKIAAAPLCSAASIQLQREVTLYTTGTSKGSEGTATVTLKTDLAQRAYYSQQQLPAWLKTRTIIAVHDDAYKHTD